MDPSTTNNSSDLNSIAQAIEGSIVGIVTALNPPTVTVPAPGTTAYAPGTAAPLLGGGNSTLLLIAAVVVVVLLVKKH